MQTIKKKNKKTKTKLTNITFYIKKELLPQQLNYLKLTKIQLYTKVDCISL